MTPRTPGSAALILAAVLAAMLAALAITVWEGVRAVDDARAALRRTITVVSHLNELADVLGEAESGSLRFLLTGNESERVSGAAARIRTAAIIPALKAELADTPEQVWRVTVLEQQIALRFGQINRLMSLAPGREGPLAGEDIEGAETRRQIDGSIGELIAIERQVLVGREERFATRTLWAIGLAAMVLVLIIGAAGTAAFYGFLLHTRRLQLLADAIPGLVAYLGRDGRYRFVNRTYKDWFDIEPKSLIGKTPTTLADEEAAPAFQHYLSRALAGEVVTYEIERPFPRTDRRMIRGHLVPDIDGRGRVRGAFSLILDVEVEDTNRRVLDLAREAAQAESRAKSSFLATASHDLRQPLHALTLFLSALDRRVSGDEPRAIVASMRASVRSMQEMFRTLLDISKIDAGVLVPQPQAFAVGELITRLATEFTGPASAKGLRLYDVPTRARVVSDPVLLESIRRNLLSNAVKVTRQGGILIAARRRGERLRLEVYDTGPGIAREAQERVFEEFERAGDKSAAEGLGLGLAIVRRLARLLGTEVTLRSRAGRGCCFAVEVPLASGAAPAPVAAAASASLVGRHVLIVDDNFTLASALSRELGDRGCITAMAGDATQALAALAASPAPEAGVLDYDLGPGLNGIALAEALERARGAAFPLIIVTGSTDPQVIAALVATGRPFLTKPVEAEILAASLAELLARP